MGFGAYTYIPTLCTVGNCEQVMLYDSSQINRIYANQLILRGLHFSALVLLFDVQDLPYLGSLSATEEEEKAW